MIKIGIECENIEDSRSRWGVGRLTFNLLKEYSANLEWQKKYQLHLYFKKRIPDDEFLRNPIFIKRVMGFPSFNIFYHILMPIRAMYDRLDLMFFPAYMLPPLYMGKSIVMLTDDVYYEYKYGTLPFKYRLAYRLFTNWAAKFATKIMAISETSKKELSRLYGIKSDRIFFNHLGVDIHKTTNPQLPIKNYILYVGQMFPRRNARETILAFGKISSEFPDLKLVMIGKDKYRPPVIRELIKEVNNKMGEERIIQFDYLEKNEEIEKIYTEAKALIYVSDREAFGLPPMEALSLGIPPVIADNELGHELFGEYAFYVKNTDPKGISDGMRQALTETEKIGRIYNLGPKFTERYSWHKFADTFFKNIEK